MTTITINDRLPNVSLYYLAEQGPKTISIDELCSGKRIVIFALPGAFTPTCSKSHLPGFIARYDEIKAAGIDDIVCLSVNDAWVMAAWAEQQQTGGIRMLGDGSADFTDAIGMAIDRTEVGMGVRSKRYAMIVEDGIVRWLASDEQGLQNSSAEQVLAQLQANA